MAETDTTAEVPKEPTPEADAAAEQAAREEAFSAGYEGDAPETTQTADAAATTEAEPKAEGEQPTEKPAGSPAAPKTFTFTEDDYKLLRAAAEEAPGLKQQLSKAFGTIGTLQEQINQIKGQKGRVKIKPEAFARMREEFPEVADALMPALEATEIDTSAPATQVTQPPTAVDPDAIKEKIRAELLVEQQTKELALLDYLRPDWKTIVGKRGEETGYRKWLAAQPEAYRTYVETSQSAQATAQSIRKYEASLKPATATPVVRRDTRLERLRDATPPRGSGTPPSPAMPTRQDAFNEGYRTG